MVDIDKLHKQHIEEGIASGNLNDELLDDNNIRIICCGLPSKEQEIKTPEWLYYTWTVFDLEHEKFEKLYKTKVDSFYTEYLGKNSFVYNIEDSFLYIIPSCLSTWSYDVGSIGYIYRNIHEIFKLAFEKPDERIIKEYMWSDDSNNIYRRFNKIMMKKHNKTIDNNKKINELLNNISNLVR